MFKFDDRRIIWRVELQKKALTFFWFYESFFFLQIVEIGGNLQRNGAHNLLRSDAPISI